MKLVICFTTQTQPYLKINFMLNLIFELGCRYGANFIRVLFIQELLFNEFVDDNFYLCPIVPTYRQ